MINQRKTVEQVERQVERISGFVGCPLLILKAFQSLPEPPGINRPSIEIKILTVLRAPLIRSLAQVGYRRAAPHIFDYAQKTRLTSERAECIYALGLLNCREAIPFIESTLEQSRNWYHMFATHGRARGVDEVLRSIVYSEEALRILKPKD